MTPTKGGVGKWPGDVGKETNEAYYCGEESEISAGVLGRTRCQRGETDDDGPRADDECRFVMNTEDGDSHIFEGARKPVCEREACSLDNCWCSGVDRTDGFSDCECSERRRRSSKTSRHR